jgi:hypothetical protein
MLDVREVFAELMPLLAQSLGNSANSANFLFDICAL